MPGEIPFSIPRFETWSQLKYVHSNEIYFAAFPAYNLASREIVRDAEVSKRNIHGVEARDGLEEEEEGLRDRQGKEKLDVDSEGERETV